VSHANTDLSTYKHTYPPYSHFPQNAHVVEHSGIEYNFSGMKWETMKHSKILLLVKRE